ncbi:protein of unknown function [Desulfurobacterium pacificum]|uniref:DUF1858 domain-containing protein n=1 Tax=Desulfurobacterium pacificum TaxID=240166 RepID=A0ABY1NU56_9BACT|nr:hypothetical protein [Desulfurobacterium pacificum]SMP18506.1 protein of unknown function [Desulfurobacterium pacificum]
MFVNLSMTLRECLEKYPEVEDILYRYIEECLYCEGFKDEPLEVVLKAHKLQPEKVVKEINEFLKEKRRDGV